MAIQYANITKLENDLTDIADAIRTKTGKSEKLNFPEGYINEVENNLYNNNDFADLSKPKGIIFSSKTNPGAAYGIANRTGITGINIPNATSIVANSFRQAPNVTYINAPEL
jgi:hypothetical protein